MTLEEKLDQFRGSIEFLNTTPDMPFEEEEMLGFAKELNQCLRMLEKAIAQRDVNEHSWIIDVLNAELLKAGAL